MRKQIVLGSLLLVFAVGAAGHRYSPQLAYDLEALDFTRAVSTQRPQLAERGYPVCRSRSEDRCIQLPRTRRARADRAPRLDYAQLLGPEVIFTSRTRRNSTPAGPRVRQSDRPAEPIGL